MTASEPQRPPARGTATPVECGYIVDGVWEYCSGIPYASHFIGGARHAYELIVTAFAAADRATLKPLLSNEVYAAFDGVMKGREERHEKVSFTFVGFKELSIAAAELKGRMADVTVSFQSQFISATMDANGVVIDGDPKTVRNVTDLWTFERDTRASDPNWALVAPHGEA